MSKPESEFPTIRAMQQALARLVDKGLGDLPIQILVAPDSTLQAIAQTIRPAGGPPALMIDLESDTPGLPVSIISTDRMGGAGMPSTRQQ